MFIYFSYGEEERLIELIYRRDCFCNYQFNVKACSVQGIYKTKDVIKNDLGSLACSATAVDVISFSPLPYHTF